MSENTAKFLQWKEMQKDPPPSSRNYEMVGRDNFSQITKDKRQCEIEAQHRIKMKGIQLQEKVLSSALERGDVGLKELEYKDLLGAAIKLTPTLVETTVNNTFTFADMVAKATIELEKIKEIDVSEGVTVESNRNNEDVSDGTDSVSN